MESERIELQKSLVNEISRGMGQLKQVKVSSSEHERVVERMVSSYEEALFILTGRSPEGQCESVITSSSNTPPAPPPPSAGKGVKRKAQQRHRTISVQGGYDDGYGWRKYKEKEILNSIYPRSYFKCSQSESCGARKHVRRSENDPTTVDVTYTGVHTCRSENDPAKSMAISASSENDPAKSMAISASSEIGHIGQDQEHLKVPEMELNEMADYFEFRDLIGNLDAQSMASSVSSNMSHKINSNSEDNSEFLDFSGILD